MPYIIEVSEMHLFCQQLILTRIEVYYKAVELASTMTEQLLHPYFRGSIAQTELKTKVVL